MTHFVVLVISLFAFWLLLSGFWDNSLLIFLGLVSSIFATWIETRCRKTSPLIFDIKFAFRFPLYIIWLCGQIWKANIDTAKRIWFPTKYPISPSLKKLKVSQSTDMGKTVYANSITITPGTVSMDIEDNTITVHALALESIKDLEAGTMDKKVTQLESSK